MADDGRPFVLTRSGCDNAPRWPRGFRFERLFEDRCDRYAADGDADHPAVDLETGAVSFAELDAMANRLARRLLAQGLEGGARVAILLAGTPETYAAMLGVLKAGGVFVPLDASFPVDRVAYIVADAGVRFAITAERHAERFPCAVGVIRVDSDAGEIAALSGDRLGAQERREAQDDLCYVIYTSGTTGRPKGVQIEHRQIANFVTVAGETYGIASTARMYQGLTIAFDFSVEEIWVPLLLGATLVPGPVGLSLVGQDLADFIMARNVTAMCCVPTLLATIDAELPGLDFLLVSGEACPADLVVRWSRPGRRFLNAYGPTEATVTATLGEPRPGRPVTIGAPLPTYAVAILEPDAAVALPRGATGEIALAGVGLSPGYLNRQDLTERAFIDDFLDIPDNVSGKLYRTGDLGRVTEDGEIEYLGRIDLQVKIRGYRIELTEIESVLMQTPGVAQAVVEKHQPEPGVVELAAYYTLNDDGRDVTAERLFAEARARLPSYMVPAYYERLDAIPMLESHKADRKSLPAPSGQRMAAASGRYDPPRSPTESVVAAAIARVLNVEQVSVTDHLFDDLGANSLIIARACAAIRQALPGADLAMRDVYLNPNVRDVAARLDARSAAPEAPPAPKPVVASDAAYWLSGLGQAAAFVAYTWLLAVLAIEALDWASDASGWLEVYLRAVLVGAGVMAALSGLPVALKWTLIGRFKPARFPVWSAVYLRFWIVKMALRSSPMQLFAGTPLYAVYLRTLGAKIGHNAAIFAQQPPVATDLLSVGDGAVIRKDVSWSGYRAEAGMIEVGPIAIGRDAYVGEGAALDIHTHVGAEAQLGHVSALGYGETIPDGARRHGSPAVETRIDYRLSSSIPPSSARAAAFTAFQLAALFLLTLPAPIVAVVALHDFGTEGGGDNPFHGLANPVIGSLVLYFGALAFGLATISTLPRLAAVFVPEGVPHPLYGPRHALARWIARVSNSRVFNVLLGDSSYILYYLRLIGYSISLKRQMGSNFGLVQRHDSPFACEIGDGTLVSDGLSIANLEISKGAFQLSRVRLGSENFLGNSIIYPAGGRVGDNCLLATKVMVPLDGPVRENVGLLGSPSFEIPRSVKRDLQFERLKAPGVFERRLAAKNRSNLLTIALYLASRWLLSLIGWTIAAATFDAHGVVGSFAIAGALLLMTTVTAVYFVALERIGLGFGRLEPKFCSIYDPYYWGHERYWKLNDTTFIRAFDGTPFKNLIWRMLGARWGKKVFDDGCTITERTLVSVGDNCTINELVTLQSHSLEDGAFKSDHVRIGAGCTIGTRAYVSYGVVMEDGASLDPDAFLMKGETVSAGSVWRGNPAREIRR